MRLVFVIYAVCILPSALCLKKNLPFDSSAGEGSDIVVPTVREPEELVAITDAASSTSPTDAVALMKTDKPAKPLGEKRLNWQFHDPSADVDAWVWLMHEKPEMPVFDPALLSVGQALHSAGANVGVLMHPSNAMVTSVINTIQKGRQPLVVGVAYLWSTQKAQDAWASCREAGAFMVLYQSEPMLLSNLDRWFPLFQPNEIWDYAHANLQHYPESAKHIYRYMPPGYVKQFDLGVYRVSASRSVNSIGYLGEWKTRAEGMDYLYHKAFGGHLVDNYSIWNNDRQMAEWLTNQPIQLTVHKVEDCCPSKQPVEAFRLSGLLSNGVCVMSARAYPEDEKEWKDIVHFAAPVDMAARLEQLGKDVLLCQRKSFDRYTKQFDPYAILKRSGFLKVWQPAKKFKK